MNEHFFPLDEDSGGRVTTDSRHNAVHEGRMFGFHIENLTATVGTVINVHYRTGDKPVHIDAVRQAVGGRVQTILYEDVTVATVGTNIVQYRNKNRKFPDTNSMVIRTDSTFSTVGTTILSTTQILATSTNQAKGTSSIKDEAEWVLKENSDYLARTTFTADTVYTQDALFYEEKEHGEV